MTVKLKNEQNYQNNNYFSVHIESFNVEEKNNKILQLIRTVKFEKLYLIDPYFLNNKEGESIKNLISLIEREKRFENIIIIINKTGKGIEKYLSKEEKKKLKNIVIYRLKEDSYFNMHARYIVFENKGEIEKIIMMDNGFDSLSSFNCSLDICEQKDLINYQKTFENFYNNKQKLKLIFKNGELI